MARSFGIRPGVMIAHHPRRAYDLWGASAFVLPEVADASDPDRAISELLPDTDRVFPIVESMDAATKARWREAQDWQLRANRDAFPRLWVVRDVRPHRLGESASVVKAIRFGDDGLWRLPGRSVENLRTTAWVEAPSSGGQSFVLPPMPSGTDRVLVVAESPSRLEVSALAPFGRFPGPGRIL